ncbi:MAG: phosphoenolpyruvate mutase [Alphaproteobacteria bacterium]|jgi:phosphoenolpyruvate phosphomutase|nr:phosphoenolpyruvate mutase [Alphaproteobacteria bacterium]
MKKTTAFRELLGSGDLEFICEAHNGLSAKIVEEAGFKGIWGSGLTISAQYGVRDNNETSWTQVLEVLEFMVDATTVPIMLDGDTGYGSFNNFRRLIRKLEQRGVAAVCIEDKVFPKTNSFISGDTQPLSDIHEFCGKIQAGKDAQQDDDFCIVARVEAFIAGWGLGEALRRAEAYYGAGADAILIHSALSVPDEVLAFMREWDDRCPVVIVPTKYYATSTEVFEGHGFSLVIWANHLLRSSISAMQKTANRIHKEKNLRSTEDNVASVDEIFRLQGAQELKEAEKLYLPSVETSPCAVILAASRGKELGSLTEDRPKVMIDVQGSSLLSHIAEAYNLVGIKRITVVRGYLKHMVNVPGLSYVDNDRYECTGELVSLKCAMDNLDNPGTDVVISYGDIIFNKYILHLLKEPTDDFVITVDADWAESRNAGRLADWAVCSHPNSRDTFSTNVGLLHIGGDTPKSKIHGEWMGFLKISAQAFTVLRKTLDELLANPDNQLLGMPDLINKLMEEGNNVRAIYTTGNWLDIDTVQDLVAAGNFKD